MTDRQPRLHELLLQHLAELRLNQIAETYREVLDEAARQNTSMLDVLASLIASEITARRQRAMERRMRQAKLPPRKTLEEYNFTFPKRIPKAKVLRLFDCEFVSQHHSAVLIGPTGVGKSHLLNALGYTACEKGISTRWSSKARVIATPTRTTLSLGPKTAAKRARPPSARLGGVPEQPRLHRLDSDPTGDPETCL